MRERLRVGIRLRMTSRYLSAFMARSQQRDSDEKHGNPSACTHLKHVAASFENSARGMDRLFLVHQSSPSDSANLSMIPALSILRLRECGTLWSWRKSFQSCGRIDSVAGCGVESHSTEILGSLTTSRKVLASLEQE